MGKPYLCFFLTGPRQELERPTERLTYICCFFLQDPGKNWKDLQNEPEYEREEVISDEEYVYNEK